MAKKIDFKIPFIDLTKFVPRHLKNPAIDSILDNLFNKFLSHDESVPVFGYVGKKPTAADDRTPKIMQISADRDINAVQPILNFAAGPEVISFTFNDLLNKAKAIGIQRADQDWLYAESHNYVPPIDFDKFANFFNYYWVAKCMPTAPVLAWNPTLAPEYYVIANRPPSALDKPNVIAASTRSSAGSEANPIVLTGSGFKNQTFTLVFNNALDYTLTANGQLPKGCVQSISGSLPPLTSAAEKRTDTIQFDVTLNGAQIKLLSFDIDRSPGYAIDGTPFEQPVDAGDTFIFDVTFFAKTIPVAFAGSPGVKYKIHSVSALDTFQTLDGVQLYDGARVLIKNNPTLHNGRYIENGIYVVKKQDWVRAADYGYDEQVQGARVWVQAAGANSNGGALFVSNADNSWTMLNGGLDNTNDWQDGNFWVHGSEFEKYGAAAGNAVQAVRPIIEYHTGIQLSETVSAAGIPSEAGYRAPQRKSVFNQVPLFDLFRYDGTHANLASAIFFYAEDRNANLDVHLQRRVKISDNGSADFIFTHGLIDGAGHTLFYKKDDALKSIWHAGYKTCELIDVSFAGTSKGFISDIVVKQGAHAREWVLTALTTGTFSVYVAGLGYIGDAIVGVPFIHAEISFVILDGKYPFVAGRTPDRFTFSVSDELTVSNMLFTGGAKGELIDVVVDKQCQQQVWTFTAIQTTAKATEATSFTVSSSKFGALPDIATVGVPYSNGYISCLISSGSLKYTPGDTFSVRVANIETPRYSYRDKVSGEVLDVFGGRAEDTIGVGAYQVPRTFFNNPYNDVDGDLVEGTVYSHFRSVLQNQPAQAEIDYAFGGSIKGWGSQHNILASLLMQKDFSPVAVIDAAERLYRSGLNAIADIYKTKIIQYFIDKNVIVDYDGSAVQDQNIEHLLDYLLSIRETDTDVRTILFDSTSGIPGIPVSLAQIGAAPLAAPQFVQDAELRLVMLQHHDGHKTMLSSDTIEFRQAILSSDLHLNIQRSEIQDGKVVPVQRPAVGSFSDAAPTAPFFGQLWMKPNGNGSIILAYNGTQWQAINLADTLNRLMLAVEERLFDSVNKGIQEFDFATVSDRTDFNNELSIEFSKYASQNGFNTNTTDYRASDAFTWNYSYAARSSLPPLSTVNVPARWFDLLKSHQSTVPGVLPTSAPHLEPWRLFGFDTRQLWINSLSPAVAASYISPTQSVDLNDGSYNILGSVRAAKITTGLTTKIGLKTIDGVSLNIGDRVLLLNEPSSTDNGLWTVTAGMWVRTYPTLEYKDTIEVLEGSTQAGTIWFCSSHNIVLDSTNVAFIQVRAWSTQMWNALVLAKPTLKISVNKYTDELLPPYVAPTMGYASAALTNVYPSRTSGGYVFGENGPIEAFWKRTSEYQYSLVRSLFRTDPLKFINRLWGFNWTIVDGISYDSFDINLVGHKRLFQHGELISPVNRSDFVTVLSSQAKDFALSFTHDGFYFDSTTSAQLFTVRDLLDGGKYLSTMSEGAVTGVNAIVQLSIDDHGVPFRHGDVITVSKLNGTLSVDIQQSSVKSILGFAQVFTNVLRQLSIDTATSYANDAYRNWDVNIGYRAGALVNTDDLLVSTATSALTDTSYKLILKKNVAAQDLWVQALRVSVLQFGNDVSSKDGIYKPSADAADWEFLVEGYNPRAPRITYFEFDTWCQHSTFTVQDQTDTNRSWIQYHTPDNEVTVTLPIKITGLQNLITMLFGYSTYLESRGWSVSPADGTNTDQQTGRPRGWMLEIEKVIASIYRGTTFGVGAILNPFADKIWVEHDYGLLAEFTDPAIFDIDMHTGAYDMLGNRIKSEDVLAIRKDNTSELTAKVPMFSIHAQIDEYEHLFVFGDFIDKSLKQGIIYDAFSGARVSTFKFNGRIQGAKTFRPDFGGHYLIGNKVRKNIQSSTDDLQNFYDPDHVFENTTSTPHALALLGFSKKEYFNNLDISDKSQFNFWRGLIQSKGTNAAVGAFLNSSRFDDAEIDEYWAYKVASFGDARTRTYPEMRLNVGDAPQQFTNLQFDAAKADAIHGFIQVSSTDEARWIAIDTTSSLSFNAEVIGTFTQIINTPVSMIRLPFVADKLIIQTTIMSTLVDLCSTLPIVPEGPRMVDGVLADIGSSVLIKDQVGGSGNGVFIVSAGRWVRAEFANTAAKLNGLSINVKNGSSNAGKTFFQQNELTSIGDAAHFVQDTVSSLSIAQLNATEVLVNAGVETKSPSKIIITGYGPAAARYNPAKLFNYKSHDLVQEIPLWHPAANLHNPIAMESINVVSAQNPARFNKSTQVVNNNSYDPLRPWGAAELGRIWLNTGTLEYVPYYDARVFSNRQERLSRWGALTDYSTVDVYEWVQSPVPPARYEELAMAQVGSDIDEADRASGKPALEGTYTRSRVWSARAIAWSHAGVPTPAAHPSFAGSFAQNLKIEGNMLALENGLFADLGIVPEMRIGAWSPSSGNPKPLSEYNVTSQFTKSVSILDGEQQDNRVSDFFDISLEVFKYTALTGVLTFTYEYSHPTIQQVNANGDQIGYLHETYLVCTSDTGAFEKVLVDAVLAPTTTGAIAYTQNEAKYVEFSALGLRVRAVVKTSADYAIETVPAAIAVTFASRFKVLDAVYVTPIIDLPDAYRDETTTTLTNDPSDPIFLRNIQIDTGASRLEFARVVSTSNIELGGLLSVDGVQLVVNDLVLVIGQNNSALNGLYVVHSDDWVQYDFEMSKSIVSIAEGVLNFNKYYFSEGPSTNSTKISFNEVQSLGWRAWSVPTQTELDADSRQPNSSWKPYYGDFVKIAGSSAQVTEAVAYAKSPLTLNNGVAVDRFHTTWTDWEVIADTVYRETAVETGSMTIRHNETLDPLVTAVYVNGSSQFGSAFSITDNVVKLDTVRLGSSVVVVIRKYNPSAAELAFDPDVSDDLSIQRQYKKDFEYVESTVRDRDGSIIGTTYFFWVQGKTTPAKQKRMSVQAIAQDLKAGPSCYLTFQVNTDLMRNAAGQYAYNAVSIAGLANVVSKDDTYKIRFTNDFVLRDDPEEMNRKDVHTEWVLIRAGQRTRIPESLWSKLTDSICGFDAANNQVPSVNRVLYDERNSTRTRFGFDKDQTLAPSELLIQSVKHAIVNTTLRNKSVPVLADGTLPIDFIDWLVDTPQDTWFSSAEASRRTMTNIWNRAKPTQINSLFFAALEDILAHNYELTDIFKTSRLSVNSVKVVQPTLAKLTYE